MASKTKKNHKYIQPVLWRKILFVWTALSFVAVIADFLNVGVIESSLTSILIIYVAVLSAYSSEKEFRRWHDYHEGRHPGELYVLLWTIILVGLFVAEVILDRPYKM